MNPIKKIISIALPVMLTLSLLVTGAPVRSPLVADGGQSLKDALLSARDFLTTAQQPEKFEAIAKNLISALQTTAGLKTIIKKDGKTQTQCNNSVFVFSRFQHGECTLTANNHYDPFLIFISHTLIPETPPPRC